MTIAQTAAATIAERVESDLAVTAVYTRKGDAVGTEVRVSIAPAAARTLRPTGAPGAVAGGGGQPTHDGAAWRVTTRAMQRGDTPTLGVGFLGGIERLSAGDTLDVPGASVNQPQLATVRLRVGGDARYGDGGERSGYWVGSAMR